MKTLSKSEFLTRVAESTGQTKSVVESILQSIYDLTVAEIKTDVTVCIPGLVRIKVVNKPATPERQGVNPFSKETVTIAAKAASKKIKVIPVKALKDSVSI